MHEIHLFVSGEEAAAVAAEVALWARTELSVDAAVVPQAHPAAAPEDEPTRGADPVAVAALVLSIPGAIISVLDLAKRVELVPKLAKLLALVRGRKASVQLRAGSHQVALPASEQVVVAALAEAEAEAREAPRS